MLEHVYHIPVDGEGTRLVFAPLLNVAALMNDQAVELLKSTRRDGEPVAAESELGRLAAELSTGGNLPVMPTGTARPPFLGLILTRKCNMACHYCDFASADGGEVMSPELVSQAIAGWVQWVRDSGGQLLDLHFFGGEPFTQPELIEFAVHRTRFLAEKHGLATRVEASTNGLLNEHVLTFVRDHFDTIVLSLDGPAEDHDRHRPLRNQTGSFAEVWRTAVALAESPVHLCLRCCVSQANVGRMPDIARWFCQTLSPESITFEAMKPSPESLRHGLKTPDPLSFARGFVAARRLAREYQVPCIYAALYDQPCWSFCPVGRDTFIVAADRSVRSCYLRRHDWAGAGLDMRIGAVTTTGTLQIDPAAVERLRTEVAHRARCACCFCRWGCAGGCLVTETPPGHDPEFTDFCRQTRLIQACTLLEQLECSDQADRLLAEERTAACLWNAVDDRLGGGDHA